MKLYCTPGGTWAGNEAGWKAAVKAEGIDPKTLDRKTVEVPVSKAELMEWLTFHNVNPISPRHPVPAGVPEAALTTIPNQPISDLDEAFSAAPLRQRLRLAVSAIDQADAALHGK